MEHNAQCMIWGTGATMESFESANGSKGPHYVTGHFVTSPRTGGRYSITKGAYVKASSPGFCDFKKSRLTTWLINQRRFGIECPHITDEIIDNIIVSRPLPVYDRANRLLQYIADNTAHLGDDFFYYPSIDVSSSTSGVDDDVFEMLALSESINKKELLYLLNFLEQSKFLYEPESSQPDRLQYVISPIGYAHLADLATKSVDSTQAFVAMWFHPSTNEIYEKGIEPAIRNAGYNAIRIDRKDHNNKIDDEIIAEIRRSRFLVADFTQGSEGARGGVYYEAGFAHGLNIPVIFTCPKATITKVHFDTRQYNHIAWDNHEDLQNRLAQRISATIGDGPLINQIR